MKHDKLSIKQKIATVILIIILLGGLSVPLFFLFYVREYNRSHKFHRNRLKIQSVILAVQNAFMRDGKCDSMPDGRFLRDGDDKDAYGNPFLLKSDESGNYLIITSLGSDGELGGEGDAKDLIVKISKTPPHDEEYISWPE